MNRIMVDLETLGVKPGSVIVSIGAVRFNENGLEDEFYTRIDVESCVALGLKMDPSTVMWWLQQGDEARGEICKKGIDIYDALLKFDAWAKKRDLADDAEVDEFWGDGAAFDNVLLRGAFDAAGLKAPWEYWADRCYRTMRNRYPELAKTERKGTHHHALDDAKTQAERLILMMKEL